MTLEEAIKHAEEVAEEHTKYNRYGGFEGCDECAEEHRQLAEWLKDYKRLLEQQPCEDTISRQAAIDALAKFVPYAICDESTESYTNGLTDAYYLILQLPSVQPEPKWIPCDKGEPDEDTECWVTVKTTDVLYRGNFTKRYGERRNKGFITSDGFMWWNTALAWMSIYEPKPYKAESEES